MKKTLCKKIKTIITIITFTIVWSYSFSAKIFFNPQEITGNLNCYKNLEIFVNTEWKNITAIDTLLSYDPNKLKIVWIKITDKMTATLWTKISNWKLHNTSIKIWTWIKWVIKYADLAILPIKTWDTKISFVYKKNSTTDTNLAFSWKDYLSRTNSVLIHNIDLWKKCSKFIDKQNFIVNHKKEELKIKNEIKKTYLLNKIIVFSIWIIVFIFLLIQVLKKRKHWKGKKTMIIISIFLFINWITIWSNIKIEWNTNLLMYCPSNFDVKIINPDTEISSIDMILKLNSNDITWTIFSVNNSEYISPIYNKYEYNSDISQYVWKFGWTRLTNLPANWIKKHLWRFYFKNKTWILSTSFDFHIIQWQTAWDTNLSYNWWDTINKNTQEWPWKFNFLTWPCVPDTKSPIINNLSIENWAFRVIPWTAFSFFINDVSSIHADYRFTWNNFDISKYITAPINIDNQYWVDKSTINITIKWSWYEDIFSDWWIHNFNSISPIWKTRNQKDKWFNISINPIHNFHTEEEISIIISWADNTHISKQYINKVNKIIKFNSPEKPYVERNPSTVYHYPKRNDLINPELDKIVFDTKDSRAWVDSWSLHIIIKTWTSSQANWWLIKEYNYWQFWIEKKSFSYTNNWLNWSNSITHEKNYTITLTWFWELPENEYIRIIVNWKDLAYTPNNFSTPNNSFHFKTRQSCLKLQCSDWIKIYTWWNDLNTKVLYWENKIYISWWNSPFLSWNKLFCQEIHHFGLNIYTNWTEISYWNSTWWNQILSNFTWNNLKIKVIWGTAKLIWNTIYFTKTNNTWWNWGNWWWNWGGGWWWGWNINSDNCLLPYSTLPWANWEWKDYSPSYYDNTCLWENNEKTWNTIIEENNEMCKITEIDKEDMQNSYFFACKLWVITDNFFSDLNLSWNIKRKEFAPIISNYAINFLNKRIDYDKKCNFNDINFLIENQKNWIKKACQLWLMWLNSDWSLKNNFNPEWNINLAEFWTILSRLLFWEKYNTKENKKRYILHLNKLYKDNIIDDISQPFSLISIWDILKTLKRTDKTNFMWIMNYEKNNTENICSMSPFWEELENAYLYACNLRITTKPTIKDADMFWAVYRIHLAKMISVYAIKVLWLKPDFNKKCYFKDLNNVNYELRKWWEISCQLWLMWLKYDWKKPLDNFMPYWKVNRAQFGTIMSRLLFKWKYNWNKKCRYCSHLNALKKYWIMNNISNPKKLELRWYVMLMMERANKILEKL